MMRFETILFCADPAIVGSAARAGIDAVIVDWEQRGKERRQKGADTEINQQTLADLQRVRACTDQPVLCRINGFGPHTGPELELAISAGADEILLPMVKSAGEVQQVLRLVGDRCKVGILVETVEAVAEAPELARLPLSRVYLGLNDLAIARQTPFIFTAVADGTVARVRQAFPQPFGFAGLTLPDCGNPVPCRLLMAEMARLGCSFSFLRRSFYRDIQGRRWEEQVPRIQEALRAAFSRTAHEIERDRLRLLEILNQSAPNGMGSCLQSLS